MPITTIRAAVVQMTSGEDIAKNLETITQLTEQAARQGATLVTLPENFCYLGSMRRKLELAEPLDSGNPGPILAAMVALARSAGVHLLLGGMPTQAETPQRFYNTAVLLDPEGAIAASYHKIHLFDVDIPDGAVFKESEHVVPGREAVVAPLGSTTMGLTICYDLRFPELFRRLAGAGAEICCVPAAFTMHTGKDHWLPLLRARAIENQTYILAPAQYGRHNDQRVSYGKSCIVDPWGAVIAQVPDREGVAVAELDLAYLQKVRAQLPCLQHIRLS
jgi:predicted amidohydrolase